MGAAADPFKETQGVMGAMPYIKLDPMTDHRSLAK
jgi:hypothetical protein